MEETKKTRIRLSDHFTYGRLLRFTLPSIVMMIFTSIYCVVDGFFVSNYVGKTSFASVNFTWPFIMILGSIGFMFGCAVIAKTMGEGRQEKARELFSFFVLAAAICGVVIGVLGWFFIRPLCALLGASMEITGDYPAWEYKRDSALRDTMVRVFTEQYGHAPKIEAIHAGLECGLFSGKLPGLDCVSFGPDLLEIHTPREKMSIPSVQRTWKFLLGVLEALKD